MTYSQGSLIVAADYNGFVSDTAGANINDIWGAGSGDKGWGQTAISTVSATNTVTATQWASLVNTLSSMGTQTSTTLTARSAPTTGVTISILSAVNTDLTNCTTNRGNAASSGSMVGTWTGSSAKTAGTASATGGWTITYTQNVTFGSAAMARYFFNAGGLIRLDYAKSSTGTDKDPDWNTLAGYPGQIYFSGRVAGAAQQIAGSSYTGTTRAGGSGGTETTLATTTGFYSLTNDAAATTIFQLTSAVSPYTGDYIRTTVNLITSSTVLRFITTWVDAGWSGAGKSNDISGGTDTTSPNTGTSYGTAPLTLVRFLPPSTTTLTDSWGTPTVASTIS